MRAGASRSRASPAVGSRAPGSDLPRPGDGATGGAELARRDPLVGLVLEPLQRRIPDDDMGHIFPEGGVARASDAQGDLARGRLNRRPDRRDEVALAAGCERPPLEPPERGVQCLWVAAEAEDPAAHFQLLEPALVRPFGVGRGYGISVGAIAHPPRLSGEAGNDREQKAPGRARGACQAGPA